MPRQMVGRCFYRPRPNEYFSRTGTQCEFLRFSFLNESAVEMTKSVVASNPAKGTEKQLDPLAQKLLGVSIEEIKSALK